jgi:phage replication O-like protein O
MANPQIKNGYTQISNDILEAIIKMRLSGHEFRIALLIIRKTNGFHRQEDAISLSQMHKSTGLSITRCSQVVNALQLKGVITITEKCKGKTKKYAFNKNLDEWQDTYRKVKETITEKCKGLLQFSASTKESIKEKKEIMESKRCFDSTSFFYFLLLKRTEGKHIDAEAVKGIKFFLFKYKRHRGREHPDLRFEQWDHLLKTVMTCDREGETLSFSLPEMKRMIYEYFMTRFTRECDYSILHFNTDGIKLRRSFEAGVC